jgi:hypothetical protein
MCHSNFFLITHPLQPVQSPTAEAMAKNCKMVVMTNVQLKSLKKKVTVL